jgi:hypothetical protein
MCSITRIVAFAETAREIWDLSIELVTGGGGGGLAAGGKGLTGAGS